MTPETSTPDAPATASGATGTASIAIRSASRTFRLESGETITAVDDVTLDVAPGEFVCLLGPSGHGKSTLLNLVAGFIPPTSGSVEVGGAPVTGPGPDRGVVFQRDTLFLWKRVADNIGFGLKARGVPKAERERTVAKYLGIIGLEGYARAWPKQLSGGMRRRVAIATVFANEPDVLLMDEPFTGLDYARRATLHGVLLELWRGTGRTVLFVTHDIDEAIALGDRIVVIRDGRVAWDTPVPIARPRTAGDLAEEPANRLRGQILAHLELANSPA
jgi:NitT/TauT family transport system ATP-binding protein